MLRIGAHMSVAGGVSRAVERAVLHRCEALQIFAKNANQWRARPLEAEEIERFRQAMDAAGLAPAVSHASYLINMATADPALRSQSFDALLDELDRAEALGLQGVVIHPGTQTSGTEADALALVGEMIGRVLAARPGQRVMVLLEHTAGQGRTIGHRFEHLAAILGHVNGHRRVGVCLDTCHLFASGYDIASAAGYSETFDTFQRLVGFDRLHAIHANDSKKPCGSRVDRHAHIGDGCLGLAPFERLLHDKRFHGLPMLLETEKTAASGTAGRIVLDPLDVRNLDTLRRLRAT